MTKAEIESRLATLKAQQADFFKKSKKERNAESLVAVREEMNKLKVQVAALYKGNK